MSLYNTLNWKFTVKGYTVSKQAFYIWVSDEQS